MILGINDRAYQAWSCVDDGVAEACCSAVAATVEVLGVEVL
jgi:hypothetical protein